MLHMKFPKSPVGSRSLLVFFAVMTTSLFLSRSFAQSTTSLPDTGAMIVQYLTNRVPLARSEDVSSPEAIVRAINQAVSGPKGKWDSARLRSLCIPSAHFYRFVEDKDHTLRLTTKSLDDTVHGFTVNHLKNGVYASTDQIDILGSNGKQNGSPGVKIAVVESVGGISDRPESSHGTDHAYFTLVFFDNRWWVVSRTG